MNIISAVSFVSDVLLSVHNIASTVTVRVNINILVGDTRKPQNKTNATAEITIHSSDHCGHLVIYATPPPLSNRCQLVHYCAGMLKKLPELSVPKYGPLPKTDNLIQSIQLMSGLITHFRKIKNKLVKCTHLCHFYQQISSREILPLDF